MIYLDNSATTPVSAEAARVMAETAEKRFGNPSSLHMLGLNAEHIVTSARNNILSALTVPCRSAKNFIFTSGGSEANNLAILGCLYSKQIYRGKRAVFGSSEHPSVYECARRLREDGFDVVFISSKNGAIDQDELKSVITPNTVFFSHMHVNNETGALYDIKSAFEYARSVNPDIVTHTDAVQSFMKTKVPVGRCGADMISVSGHKIFAPKGIGGLYVSDRIVKTKNLRPLILGGGQENGLRSGTENVPGIAAIGEAVTHGFDIDGAAEAKRYLIDNLPDGMIPITPERSAGHIVSVLIPGVRSETMLHFLSSKEIFVSSGSACSSKHKDNRVLREFGIDRELADTAIRFSFAGGVPQSDLDLVISALKEGAVRLSSGNK